MRLLTRIRSHFDLHRAGSAYARGDLARAYETYREIASNFDGSTRVMILNRLGMLSYALGNKQTAKGWYEQAIAVEPDEPGLYMNLANALDDLGEGPAARAAYEQALSRSRRPDLLYNFAVFVAKSDPHAATRLLRETLDDPDAMRKVELPAELPLQKLVSLGGEIVVEVVSTTVGKNCVVALSLTQPVDVAKIPRRRMGIRFVEHAAVRDCSQP
jgi:Flp pilus assembly protein TadD